MSWNARSAAAELDRDVADVVVIVGPTASGKSALALELAERLGGEIIGADSVQVYRHFDVGSSKPSEAERQRIVHHLVDVADPRETFDAASYAAEAARAIAAVQARGRLPVVCGGTFLWVRSLLYGLADAPRADAARRARHLEWASAEGRGALHARLAEVDPVSAARLAPNDLVRVSRALEVFELTGRALSALQAEHGFRRPRYAARLFGVRWPADQLMRRIEQRTRRALDAGWVDEVERLLALGYRDARAMASVGYRQVLERVDGKLRADELGPAIDRATKIFARRQRTWLRAEAITWIDPMST